MKNLIIFAIFLTSITFSAQKVKSTYFQNKIANTTVQYWVAGVQGGGSGIIFTIEFKDSLPENIILENVYFKNQKTKIVLHREKKYVANFTGTANKKQEAQVPEYDSYTKPVVINPPFPISENQAILEYTFKKQKRFFKILNVKEIPSLEYPQARPRDN